MERSRFFFYLNQVCSSTFAARRRDVCCEYWQTHLIIVRFSGCKNTSDYRLNFATDNRLGLPICATIVIRMQLESDFMHRVLRGCLVQPNYGMNVPSLKQLSLQATAFWAVSALHRLHDTPDKILRASSDEIMKAARDNITNKIPINLVDDFVVQMLNTIGMDNICGLPFYDCLPFFYLQMSSMSKALLEDNF